MVLFILLSGLMMWKEYEPALVEEPTLDRMIHGELKLMELMDLKTINSSMEYQQKCCWITKCDLS